MKSPFRFSRRAGLLRWLLLLALSASTVLALDYSGLENIPIQEGGRKKPYLVFTEEMLLSLSGKHSFVFNGKKQSAIETVTAIWLSPTGWSARPIILVNHKGLKEALGLDPARKLFSYDELASNPALITLLNEAEMQRARTGNQRLAGLPKEATTVGSRMSELQALMNGSVFRFIASPHGAEATWQPIPGQAPEISALRTAFEKNDNTEFLKESHHLAVKLEGIEPRFQPPTWKMALESIYQKSHPFFWAWVAYAIAGGVLIFFGKNHMGYYTAWVFTLIGLLFQVAGFVVRVLIAGRAPVTNMYESVVWVAFGTVFFALVFEAIYRSRYFLLGAIPIAVASLILADTQTVALDRTISPLTAVLRDNFWLTTHVLTITLSYAAFALALGIGHIILGGIILGKKPGAGIYNNLYRAIQVGVLLLAIGTILGGVWANYSWGRFWDWDPKETWALITLLGYLFLLHGRIAGKWGGFGLAVGSVLAFQCVLMAWYGVNFVLGVGLHSYGFGTGGFGWAICFVIAELVFVAAAVRRQKNLKGKSQPALAPQSNCHETESVIWKD